jgi:hypothetical protein
MELCEGGEMFDWMKEGGLCTEAKTAEIMK